MTSPIVSICCATYNHASFINKALDGFLMQEPPIGVTTNELWVEILIHDDASTDGTDTIIREYAAKYPKIIFPLYEEENQYTKGHVADIDMYNYKRARGKYIAYCEGDDYWTDPLKLQKQVNFMEKHPEYSICFHGNSVHDLRSGAQYESGAFRLCREAQNKTQNGIDVTALDYLKGEYGQPLTMMFRLSMYNFEWHKQYKYYRDTHEIYHLLRMGKGFWMNFNGGVYNKHDQGMSASLGEKQYQISFAIAYELYQNNHETASRWYYITTLQWLIYSHVTVPQMSRLSMVLQLFMLTGNVRHLIKNLCRIK